MAEAKIDLEIQIRRLTLFEVEQALPIERQSFDSPWVLEDFELAILEERCDAIAASVPKWDRIIGYVVAKRHRECAELWNLAVHPRARRCGIARALVGELKKRSPAIEALVREANLGGQLFLRACGFRAVHVVRRPFDDVAEDGYLFRWAISGRGRR